MPRQICNLEFPAWELLDTGGAIYLVKEEADESGSLHRFDGRLTKVSELFDYEFAPVAIRGRIYAYADADAVAIIEGTAVLRKRVRDDGRSFDLFGTDGTHLYLQGGQAVIRVFDCEAESAGRFEPCNIDDFVMSFAQGKGRLFAQYSDSKIVECARGLPRQEYPLCALDEHISNGKVYLGTGSVLGVGTDGARPFAYGINNHIYAVERDGAYLKMEVPEVRTQTVQRRSKKGTFVVCPDAPGILTAAAGGLCIFAERSGRALHIVDGTHRAVLRVPSPSTAICPSKGGLLVGTLDGRILKYSIAELRSELLQEPQRRLA